MFLFLFSFSSQTYEHLKERFFSVALETTYYCLSNLLFFFSIYCFLLYCALNISIFIELKIQLIRLYIDYIKNMNPLKQNSQ